MNTYGIWDMKDACWLGNEAGPLRYTEKEKGMLAVCIANARMESRRRFVLKVLPETAFRKKDSITPTVSGPEALKRLLEDKT